MKYLCLLNFSLQILVLVYSYFIFAPFYYVALILMSVKCTCMCQSCSADILSGFILKSLPVLIRLSPFPHSLVISLSSSPVLSPSFISSPFLLDQLPDYLISFVKTFQPVYSASDCLLPTLPLVFADQPVQPKPLYLS